MRARAFSALGYCAILIASACEQGDPSTLFRPVIVPVADAGEGDREPGNLVGTGRLRAAAAATQSKSSRSAGAPAAEGGSDNPPAAGDPGDATPPPPASDPGPAGAPAPPPFVDPRFPWPMFEDDAGVADEDDAGTPPPRPGCDGKPGSPGNTIRKYGDREYIVHIPPTSDPNSALPVMFVYHGAGGKGADMQQATGFDILADAQGVITVYPTGQAGNAPWNVGRNVCAPGNLVSTTADDVAYFDSMLDDIERDQCLDRGRVFVTGFSMGGYYSNQIGCQLGRNRLRAIAPHSGGTHSGSCEGGALPVLLLHGDADSLINYRCGTQARDYWVDRNGCSADYDTWEMTGGQCQFHRGCPRDAQVVLCTFFGMDHAWGYPPMWESSSLLIWSFFSSMM